MVHAAGIVQNLIKLKIHTFFQILYASPEQLTVAEVLPALQMETWQTARSGGCAVS